MLLSLQGKHTPYELNPPLHEPLSQQQTEETIGKENFVDANDEIILSPSRLVPINNIEVVDMIHVTNFEVQISFSFITPDVPLSAR